MNSSEYIQLKKWATYNANPDAYTGIDDPNLMRVGDVFRDQEEMEGYLAGNDTAEHDIPKRHDNKSSSSCQWR